MSDPYRLAIGQRSYSSWSLRAWLLFARSGLPVETVSCRLYSADFGAALAPFAPARTVPALLLPGAAVVTDSLAIAEELASRHPGLGLWPADPAGRARARSISAEMHAGFGALRAACPMNLRCSWTGFRPSAEVLADLARIEQLWDWARQLAVGTGPWLFGNWSAADAMFAPVAARIAGYGLPVSAAAGKYVAAQLADPDFIQWRATGLAAEAELPQYEMDLPRGPWPGA